MGLLHPRSSILPSPSAPYRSTELTDQSDNGGANQRNYRFTFPTESFFDLLPRVVSSLCPQVFRHSTLPFQCVDLNLNKYVFVGICFAMQYHPDSPGLGDLDIPPL